MDEVAALAGVSRATVSRVVNASPKVSPNSRAAVERAIAELGYVPNPAARSLVTRRTDTVALLVGESESRIFVDPFFGITVHAIASALMAIDLQPVLLLGQSGRAHEKASRYVRQGHVDGVILMSLHGADPLPKQLRAAGIPLVVFGRPLAKTRVPFVDADNRGGARLATEHLLRRGRRVVGAVTGPLDMQPAIDRLQGYRDALRQAGIPVRKALTEPGDFTEIGGERAVSALLHRCPGLDAITVGSDSMAFGALRALAAAGRKVPDDVAVVGFDDIPAAQHADPALTTIRQPFEDMARHTRDLLVQQLAGTAHGDQFVIVPTCLIERAST